MAWPDGLFNGAAGTNLDAINGVYVTDWSGLLAPGVMDAPPGIKVPYARGTTAVTGRKLAAYDFEIPIVVFSDGAGVLANINAIKTWLVNSGGAGTYMRRVTFGTGAATDHTATLSFEGGLDAEVKPGAIRANLTLTFRNHDGCWMNGVTEVWP